MLEIIDKLAFSLFPNTNASGCFRSLKASVVRGRSTSPQHILAGLSIFHEKVTKTIDGFLYFHVRHKDWHFLKRKKGLNIFLAYSKRKLKKQIRGFCFLPPCSSMYTYFAHQPTILGDGLTVLGLKPSRPKLTYFPDPPDNFKDFWNYV